MAVSSTPVLPQTPKLGLAQILPADASAWKTVITGGTNGTKVVSLTLTSTDTSNRIVQVAVTRSATQHIFNAVTVTAGAGTDGTTTSIDGLPSTLPVDNDGQKYLFLESGDTLDISATTTVTAAKVIDAMAPEADF